MNVQDLNTMKKALKDEATFKDIFNIIAEEIAGFSDDLKAKDLMRAKNKIQIAMFQPRKDT